MSSQARFTLRGRNPDVLTCIANLSNDEVFTPPEFANRMLDTLTDAWADANGGANIWADKTVKFLDPCTKSGVFLREITSRLAKGLEREIPDLGKRVNHILTKQVFGLGITRITSLLARRSVYCSKHAKGKHSIASAFVNDTGNIWFGRTEHSWVDGRCNFCSAPRTTFDRDLTLENHAYAFIHTDDIRARGAEWFGGSMQFDVVIGNPPYQMTGGAGGSSDSSIYQMFVEQAIRLDPRFLTMVIPARWMAGGRGLGDFRELMLTTKKLAALIDYPVSKEVFPGVEVKGGICYFLWDSVHNGATQTTTIRDGIASGPVARDLSEFDVFVRHPRAAEILKNVLANRDDSIIGILSGDTPFGIATNFDGFHAIERQNDVSLHYVRSGKRDIGYLDRGLVTKNTHLIDRWKVLAPKAGSDGGQKIPDIVLGRPWIAPPGSVCTQTFIAFEVASQNEAQSLSAYLGTKFFRFLVSLRKITQDALRGTYTWVPAQSWDRVWTDEELYRKYKLSDEQIAHIESQVKPMALEDVDDD